MGESDQIFQHTETERLFSVDSDHETGPLYSLLLLVVDGKLHPGLPGAELSLQLPPHLGDQLEVRGGAEPQLQPVHLPPDSHFHT